MMSAAGFSVPGGWPHFLIAQAGPPEVAGQRFVAELTEAKKAYMQRIVSWNLPEAKAKDIAFVVHSQLRRKHKRVQTFYVRHASTPTRHRLCFCTSADFCVCFGTIFDPVALISFSHLVSPSDSNTGWEGKRSIQQMQPLLMNVASMAASQQRTIAREPGQPLSARAFSRLGLTSTHLHTRPTPACTRSWPHLSLTASRAAPACVLEQRPRAQNLGKKREKQDGGAELAFRLGETRVALGAGMEAKARHLATGETEDVVVFFGIIDFLQARTAYLLHHIVPGILCLLRPGCHSAWPCAL